MKGRRSLQDLVRDSGVNPVREPEPNLPPPTQPAVLASEEDHAEARRILVERRVNDPDYRDPNKQLKRLFKSSKEKAKSQDTTSWTFSQEELDNALSDLIEKPATGPGLVQAFLNFGAKVNFVEAASKKKGKQPLLVERRRSTVLQRAATVKRFDSVSLLASSGADQVTLDEGLKAAIAANDASCVQELLRHGADLNKCPNALADAVRANDLNFIRLLLRAPKALKLEVLSTCLPAAVQQKSEPIVSLLIGNGADPNFDGASALSMAISQREYRLAVALAAGPIPLMPASLQSVLASALKMPTAQELYQMLQLLICCGLPPTAPGLEGLLIAVAKNNHTAMAELLVRAGVSTTAAEAECLRIAVARSNWTLTDAILETPIQPAHATAALSIVPKGVSKPERLHIISALVRKGANGKPVQDWLVRAVEESDSQLMDLLLNAGVPVSGSSSAIHAAVLKKDLKSLQMLLASRSASPEALAFEFSFLRFGYTPPERLQVSRLLLEHGARGPEVDQALVAAVADTSTSRDVALITELVRGGASVNHDNGRAIQFAVKQTDVPILRLLCSAKPTVAATSAALPLVFDANGLRQVATLPMIELLIAEGVEKGPATSALETAVTRGSANLDIIQRLIAADARLLGPAFQQVVTLRNVHEKIPLLKFLLTKGIPQELLDQALATELRHSSLDYVTTVAQLLLDHGASVNFNNGDALAAGVSFGDLALVRLLLSSKQEPSRRVISRAFEELFKVSNTGNRPKETQDRVHIAQKLLERGVDRTAISAALLSALDPRNSQQDTDVIADLLLQHQADVNVGEGRCFVFAAQRNDRVLFEKLLAQHPRFETLLPMLMTSVLDESTVCWCLESCFAPGFGSDALDSSKELALHLALQRYPRSENLAKLLLSHGCNPDFHIAWEVDSASGEEMLPALVWALAQPQKIISSSVILVLLNSGASPSRPSPVSEITPIALAAREGRADIVQALLDCGADPSVRDKRNRSALFYASSTSVTSVVEALTPHALPNDGSLHEAARCLQLDIATILIKHGHSPNYPSSLHQGRTALGELCLHAEIVQSNQRTKLRRLIRLFLDHGANPKFKARNERSVVILALDNPHNAVEVTEALLETEIWQDLNDPAHLYRSPTNLIYSPLKYAELVLHASRSQTTTPLTTLLLDKGCEPKFYSDAPDHHQPPGAIGLPPPLAALADRQKEHALSLRLAQESFDHAAALEDRQHQARLRRAAETQAAEQAATSAAHAHAHALAQQTHEAELARVREAERMKRGEKAAWHALLQEQERDGAAQRATIEERRRAASLAHERGLIEARKGEVEHRAGVERRMLKEKEELYERNVKRQMAITQRMDESARVHAGLRQERPAIEGAHWGTVD